MQTASPQLTFFLNLARVQAILTRRFDGHLGTHHGVGLTDFAILYYLSQAPSQKMRRIDLADMVGLTASGVTRLLAPMEKIGLVKREANAQDARVSYVTLASGGKRMLEDSLETAEVTSVDLLEGQKEKMVEEMAEVLSVLAKGHGLYK